jgi:CBS domain-containing protein
MTTKVLRAEDVMTSPVKSVELGTTLDEVAERLTDEGVTGLLVVDHQGKPAGVVSHSDVVGFVAGLERGRSFYEGGEQTPTSFEGQSEDALRGAEVDAVMTPEVIWVPAGMKLPAVARVMLDRRIHRVLVERGGAVVGIISTLDLLRAFAAPPARARKAVSRA